MNYTCDYCHQPIPEGVYPFTLRLELFPAIEPSLEISQKDLEIDFEAEMKRLIEQMEKMTESEMIEQEKIQFVSHKFTLCPTCRNRIAEQLERLGK
ncbi:hypothetical protein LLG95_14875 [bacterium]|nr:hypothetical protein [bacterium]